MINTLLILCTAVLLVILLFWNYKRKSSAGISQEYSCKEGNFFIKGKKDNFTVRKNEQITFLVKDGRIIASCDSRISNQFVYYGGTADGIHK